MVVAVVVVGVVTGDASIINQCFNWVIHRGEDIGNQPQECNRRLTHVKRRFDCWSHLCKINTRISVGNLSIRELLILCRRCLGCCSVDKGGQDSEDEDEDKNEDEDDEDEGESEGGVEDDDDEDGAAIESKLFFE